MFSEKFHKTDREISIIEFFLVKLQACRPKSARLLKMSVWKVFAHEFTKFFRAPFLTERLRAAAFVEVFA